jgi:hypothetical protein
MQKFDHNIVFSEKTPIISPKIAGKSQKILIDFDRPQIGTSSLSVNGSWPDGFCPE